VLIDWPGETSHPRRVAFIAAAGSPPPSLTDLAASEEAANAREELNALYVAMTRARRRLVISGIEPHRAPASSWWQRIEPVATPLPAPSAVAAASAPVAEFFMLEMPPAFLHPLETVAKRPGFAPSPLAGEGWGEGAEPAIQRIACPDATAPSPPTPPPRGGRGDNSTAASRIGEAMHWLLEHAADTPQGWRAERIAQTLRRFAITPEQAAQADALALRIFTGEAAWVWDTREVLEAFDEVELTHQGQLQRIDRLLRRRASAAEPETWWALDYKSAAHPEQDPQLQAQLTRYRAAIRHLHPGHAVRAAFLSGEGKLVALDP
jgi:ATP-dependent helicase/nuclease subunit A